MFSRSVILALSEGTRGSWVGGNRGPGAGDIGLGDKLSGRSRSCIFFGVKDWLEVSPAIPLGLLSPDFRVDAKDRGCEGDATPAC